MSVLIKGMEMPKSCVQCVLKRSGCPCKKYTNGRPIDCPLIEVPLESEEAWQHKLG